MVAANRAPVIARQVDISLAVPDSLIGQQNHGITTASESSRANCEAAAVAVSRNAHRSLVLPLRRTCIQKSVCQWTKPMAARAPIRIG